LFFPVKSKNVIFPQFIFGAEAGLVIAVQSLLALYGADA